MINSQFMASLAKLESVAATSAEKETINAIRGRYVAKFGTEHPYVEALNKLESVAATNAEKAEINKIRGKFGLFEMTGDLNKQNPELLDYADDELYNEGDTGSAYDEELARKNMSEEDRLSDKYGTHMSVVGDEIVRNLDPKVRKAEDEDDEAERKAIETNDTDDKPRSLSDYLFNDPDNIESLIDINSDNSKHIRIETIPSMLKSNQFNDKMFKAFSNIFTKEVLSKFDTNEIDNDELLTIYDNIDRADFQDCVEAAVDSSMLPVQAVVVTPVTVNNKQLLRRESYDIKIPVIIPPVNFDLVNIAYTMNVIYQLIKHPSKYVSIKLPDELKDIYWMPVTHMPANMITKVLLNSNAFIDAVEQCMKQLHDNDDEGVYGTLSPDTKTPEDAYLDFDESHQYDVDEPDPYEKYGKENYMNRITPNMAKNRGINHRYMPKGTYTHYSK